MGLIPQIRDLGYQVKELRLVDEAGNKSGGFAVDVFDQLTNGRFTSVRRSDISAVIYGALGSNVRTIFGDEITNLSETGAGVKADFRHAATEEFDLVIGADGLHSKVRELIFGPENDFERQVGYQVAAFEIEGYPHRDELVYMSHAMPGRQVSRFSMRDDRTLFLFIFRDEHPDLEIPSTQTGQKEALRREFADFKWECPEILDRLDESVDLYFDRVSQIQLDHWSNGRVALIGDAAACVSLLAGEGTGLAIAEAYVLAGELSRSDDHADAFAAYERRMMPFIKLKQESAFKFAPAFVPKTSLGIAFRNIVTRLMRFPFVANYFVGRDLRDNISLPDYNL